MLFFCITQSSKNFLWNFLKKLTLLFKFAIEIGGGGVQNWSVGRSVVVVPFFFIHFFLFQPNSRDSARPRFARNNLFIVQFICFPYLFAKTVVFFWSRALKNLISVGNRQTSIEKWKFSMFRRFFIPKYWCP